MDAKQIMQIFADTAYVRMGGSMEELKAAEYLKTKCAELGLKAELEPFEVDMADIHEAVFEADGVSIPCRGYRCAVTAIAVHSAQHIRKKFSGAALSAAEHIAVIAQSELRGAETGIAGEIKLNGKAFAHRGGVGSTELQNIVLRSIHGNYGKGEHERHRKKGA